MAREMKDSGIPWIGEIPAGWSIVKIKAGVYKVGSGKTPSGGATSYADEGVLFLRSQNVYDTGLELSNPTYITPEVDEEMKGTRVFPNDVLLNITGGSIGRCCITDLLHLLIHSGHYLNFLVQLLKRPSAPHFLFLVP